MKQPTSSIPGVTPSVTALATAATSAAPPPGGSRALSQKPGRGVVPGVRPRQHNSGASAPELRITKAGDAYLRRLLVGIAHHILGPFGKIRTCGAGG